MNESGAAAKDKRLRIGQRILEVNYRLYNLISVIYKVILSNHTLGNVDILNS